MLFPGIPIVGFHLVTLDIHIDFELCVRLCSGLCIYRSIKTKIKIFCSEGAKVLVRTLSEQPQRNVLTWLTPP
jgi:hypothetical protein